ncbi:MFS transporter [Benzoatithermus flavus]|uniref:MFS transporter n=1 Tax=Benzoatithermus flavus TaxID=3108223 RepID=A0ABU8XKT3_9PROT
MSRTVLVPLIVACALFMENLDSTVLSTSLPAIAASLGEDPLRLSLAITAYLFSLAVFIPISGWVADRYGARRVFRAAIVVFVLGSISCGLSGSLPAFVGARLLQGIGGAMMVPVGRLVLIRSVAKADLVRAMTYLTVPALIGPTLGPPLGGFVTTYLHWRWIFWINVPIGLLGFVLVSRFIPEVKEADPPPLDLSGFLLSAVGLVGLVFGFETIGRGVVPAWMTTVLLAAGGVFVLAYVRHAQRTPHPVLDLSLLRVPTFHASIVGGFLFRIGVGAVPFLLPLLLQAGFGLSPFASGQLTFVASLGALTMKLTAGPILKWLGFRNVLIGNAVVSAAFLGAIGLFRPDTPIIVMLAVLLAGGFFRSLQFTSINTLAYADIERAATSRATSFASMMQQLSLSVGVGTGALLLHLSLAARGGARLAAGDFLSTFLIVAAISALSALAYMRLPPDAGAEVSGRRIAPDAGATSAGRKAAQVR